MATRTSEAGATTGLLSSLVRAVLIVAFTGVETAALVAWLAVVDGAPAVSRAAAVGLGILFVGLVVEHFLTDVAVNGLDFDFPLGKALVFSASETLLWGLWLAVADRIAGPEGFLVAGAVLAVLLVPQHTIEDNVLRGRGLFADLLDAGTVGFSLVEAAGATGWLVLVRRPDLFADRLADLGLAGVDPALVGVAVLAVALLVEHVMGVTFSRRS